MASEGIGVAPVYRAAGHLKLRAALLRDGGANIMVVVGGVIPPQDFDSLHAAGVAAIFPPGTAIPEAARGLSRNGYRQKDVAE